MNTPGHIHDDAEDLSNLPGFLQEGKKGLVYQVPADYFEELPRRIMSEIRLLDLKPAEQPVPEHFFEELSEAIHHSIIIENLSISKEEPYQVPADYFDWLPSRIQDKIVTAPRVRFGLDWWKQWATVRILLPSALGVVVLLICIRFMAPAANTNESFALNEQDKKEVIENPEAFGLDESIVMEHVVNRSKILDKTSSSSDQNEAIDYLIENNVDLNSLPSDN